MAKGYQKKTRASKYEKKLAINASFEDVIKISLNMATQFHLSKLESKAGPFTIKDLNKVRFWGTTNHGFTVSFIDNHSGKIVSHYITPPPITENFDETFEIASKNYNISFELNLVGVSDSSYVTGLFESSN